MKGGQLSRVVCMERAKRTDSPKKGAVRACVRRVQII